MFEFPYPPQKLAAATILQFHPQRTAFRLFFLSLQHHLPTQASHCVNRIITIHFLEGQISCHPRVLPFPIDNRVCSSAGLTAQNSVNTNNPTSHPWDRPRLTRTSVGFWIHKGHELRRQKAGVLNNVTTRPKKEVIWMVEMTALEDSKFVFPLYKSDATECPSTLD